MSEASVSDYLFHSTSPKCTWHLDTILEDSGVFRWYVGYDDVLHYRKYWQSHNKKSDPYRYKSVVYNKIKRLAYLRKSAVM